MRTAMRLARIDVISQGVPRSGSPLAGDLNGDGTGDELVRRYQLEYEPSSHQSLLLQVAQTGSDGCTPGTAGCVALPPVTLDYTSWSPPNNVQTTIITSVSEPPGIGLNSASVELIDLNADALPDLLSTTASVHRVYDNMGLDSSGRLAWNTAGQPVGNAPPVDLASSRILLSDVNADGLADLAQQFTLSSFFFYRSTGNRAWETPAVPVTKTTTWPLWPFENPASRTLDIDHNRLGDVLWTSSAAYRLWMLLPNGHYASEVQLAPLTDGSQTFRFDLAGAHIADLNGDRLQDLVWVQNSRIVYWPSKGRGLFGGPIFLSLGTSLSASDIGKTGFADVNGDGLPDLTVVRPSTSPTGLSYWLNLGSVPTGGNTFAQLGQRREIVGLPALTAGDALRWADMNGNGSTDIVISNSTRPDGFRHQVIDLMPGVRPHLLSRIRNGMGRDTAIEYESSVDQMVRARNASTPWVTTMPISVPVVARISDGDSRGNVMLREFEYRDPYYDSSKQEFRGFAFAEVKEIGDASIPAQVTRNWFDTGMTADCLKGKLLAREVADDFGKLFTRTENTWSFRTPAAANSDVCFAFNTASDVFIYEGIPDTTIPCAGNKPETGASCTVEGAVQLRTEFELDDFGNATEDRQFGITEGGNHAIGSDEVITSMQYVVDTTAWILDRPWLQQTKALDGSIQAQQRFYYDDQALQQLGTRARLTKTEGWLNTETRWIPAIQNAYDAFGNIIRITDANGHFRTIDYDPLIHAFPTQETVQLETRSLTTTASYDFGFASVVSTIDFAGTQSDFGYDSLGRLKEIARPGGALQSFDYDLADPVSSIATRVREDTTGNTFDSFSYFDGLGRELGMKIEAEAGQWRFVNAAEFNTRGQAHEAWLPYFTSTSAYEQPDATKPKLATQYDSPGRAVRATNPDGTFSRTVFQPLVQHIWDENDNASTNSPKTLKMDGQERLIEVQERNASTCDPAQSQCACDDAGAGDNCYKTQYSWSTLGDLTQIHDAQDNIKTITYDSLRRKTFMNDPDRGHMTFEYDDAGNLTKTIDAKVQGILFGYDFANRLLTENYLDQSGNPATDPIDVTYRYDLPSTNLDFGDTTTGSASFTGGRLASVADLSGEEHFSYDTRGNILWSAKGIIDPKLGVLSFYTTRFSYDPMDRVVDIIFPDNDRVYYEYNSASLVERIDGGAHPDAKVILANIDYEPTSQLNSVIFGNGVTTTYAYDNRDRLAMLRTVSPKAGDLINYAYMYDSVSNITLITDDRPFDGPNSIPATDPRRNTQMFQYDDLYRLSQVKYSPIADGVPTHGQIDYDYDKIGNMLLKTSPSIGIPGHIDDDETVNIGAMEIGGSPSGASGKTGRNLGDPPGPHALTKTANGITPDGVYEYDANGNMTNLNGATLTWDFKDRLARYQKNDVDARYAGDVPVIVRN